MGFFSSIFRILRVAAPIAALALPFAAPALMASMGVGAAAATGTAAGAGGFFSTLGTGLRLAGAASSVLNAVGGSAGATNSGTAAVRQGGVADPNAAQAADTAATAAAEEEARRRRGLGSSGNVLTSPLGIGSGSASSMLLG